MKQKLEFGEKNKQKSRKTKQNKTAQFFRLQLYMYQNQAKNHIGEAISLK